VKPSFIRANLEVAGAVEISKPSGAVATVYVMRRGDPHHPYIRHTNLHMTLWILNRIRRALQRDHSCTVEILPGPKGGDMRGAEVVGTFPSKALALEHAAAVASALSAGQLCPSPDP
jgi:hypothetical protein